MSTFQVRPPDGGKPGCRDALILNLACFSALPTGLLAALFAFWILPERFDNPPEALVVIGGVHLPVTVVSGVLYYRGLYALRRRIEAARTGRRSRSGPT